MCPARAEKNRAIQFDPRHLDDYHLPDQELAMHTGPSNLTTPNAGLTQYECGCMKRLLSV
jgi:hypothetical protein